MPIDFLTLVNEPSSELVVLMEKEKGSGAIVSFHELRGAIWFDGMMGDVVTLY